MPRKSKASADKSKRKYPPHRGVRALWSGTISFGLVSVPVDLFPATRTHGVSFRLLAEDGTPLERRYYCPEHEKDVHPEHILRGFPVDDDQYVIVRDEELEGAEPKKSREIDLRQFVDLADISPLHFDRIYFLTPRGDSNKAYRLLSEVIQSSGLAGIATFVMRDREYLVAILVSNGVLRAATLRFEEELRTPEAVGLPEYEKPSSAQVTALERLIRKHTAKQLKTEWLKDEYTENVLQLAKRKRKQSKQVVRARREAEEQDADDVPEVDLLETIRQSLHRGSGSSAGTPSPRRSASSRPSAEELKDKSKAELYERAQELDIPGRSTMNKSQLIREIRRALEEAAAGAPA